MIDHNINGYVPRGLLGRHLRRLRVQKRIRTEMAATEANVARATLWRMERGDNRCRYKPGDVEILGRLYGADRDTTRTLLDLAKATRARSWTAAYRDLLTDTAATYIDLEGYACRIRCYGSALVPELLHGESYAAALIASSRQVSRTDVRRHVQIQSTRQKILDRQPATTMFEFILDEAALHRAVGESGTMATQFGRLAECAGQANITVKIVPYRAGTYPGLVTGAFTLLDFPTDQRYGSLPSTVHINRRCEDVLLDKATEIELYEERWNDISARTLDQLTSRSPILDAAHQFEQHNH